MMKKLLLAVFVILFISSCGKKEDEPTYSHVYGTFIDIRDGQEYRTIKIGEQTWLADNFRYLPEINSSNDLSISKPMYYVYGYVPSNKTSTEEAKNSSAFKNKGVLYNWIAAKNSTPIGWRLPTKEDFKILVESVGNSMDGTKFLKSTSGWNDGHSDLYNPNGNNKSGFDAKPSGCLSIDNSFEYGDEKLYLWSATKENEVTFYPWIFSITGGNSPLITAGNTYSYGFAVRYIKDIK